jgi:hypothetical protein
VQIDAEGQAARAQAHVPASALMADTGGNVGVHGNPRTHGERSLRSRGCHFAGEPGAQRDGQTGGILAAQDVPIGAISATYCAIVL